MDLGWTFSNKIVWADPNPKFEELLSALNRVSKSSFEVFKNTERGHGGGVVKAIWAVSKQKLIVALHGMVFLTDRSD